MSAAITSTATVDMTGNVALGFAYATKAPTDYAWKRDGSSHWYHLYTDSFTKSGEIDGQFNASTSSV